MATLSIAITATIDREPDSVEPQPFTRAVGAFSFRTLIMILSLLSIRTSRGRSTISITPMIICKKECGQLLPKSCYDRVMFWEDLEEENPR